MYQYNKEDLRKALENVVTRKMYQYNKEDLRKALDEIRKKQIKIREACRKYGVPKTTILDRLSGRVPEKLRQPGPAPLLTVEGEIRIKDWVINIAKCGFPIKKETLIDTVAKIIKDSKQNIFKKQKLDKTNRYYFTTGSRKYQQSKSRYNRRKNKEVVKRNPEISLREAESINKARAVITEERIKKWFSELNTYLEENNLLDILNDPDRVFNGDKAGFSLCPKSGKVLRPKGYKNLYSIKVGNEKENITVLIIFNASGNIADPLVVFPYIRPPRAVIENMPCNWILEKSEKGWMTGEVFIEYIANGFDKWLTEQNIKRPIILFVDGHKSHLTLPLSTWCHENHIILYALPPTTFFSLPTPYRALFGTNPKVGLSSTNLPSEIITTLETEEDLNGVLSELHRKTDENMNEDIDGLEESNISNEILITNSIGMNVTLPLASSLESVSESQETVICLNCTSQKNASCVLCSLQASILSNRDECHSGQKKAGEKMVLSAAKKLPPLKIGDCVLLPVEKIDRGPSDMQNLICVIVAHKNGVFQLGSSVGKIKGWYNRADIVAADCQFLNVENVPDKYISVREAISGVSLRDGQGYFKCSCKPSKKQCQTNRCVCFKKKIKCLIKCNSRCHTSATCLNK
ncbi:CENP-B N-terminal DNA-binding domain [Popillia japonica]|uniref:CENP-B N-terminal DNA-binding domain n=2 Tax=Popillia japonica TaxID=7064 RepID=A0AAW1KHP3_POPJA